MIIKKRTKYHLGRFHDHYVVETIYTILGIVVKRNLKTEML